MFGCCEIESGKRDTRHTGMLFTKTSIDGLWLIELECREDERGFFARTYCDAEFSAQGLNTRWPQCNLTGTADVGAIRGMHWQAEPLPEIKLVRCVRGRVWDCLVDVRPESATFGRWEAFELSGENRRMLYVGAGLAHGFQVLEEQSEMFYQMSESYVPELARGLRWDDPEVRIEWPLPVTVMSERDRGLPDLETLRSSASR